MILFITRKYPPSVGGMEKLSQGMTEAVRKIVPAKVIAWRGPKNGWPLFAVSAFFRALWVCTFQPVTFIHVSDPVLAPLGLVLSRLTGRRWGLTAHGLDVLYPNALYRRIALPCIRRANAVVAISAATREACLATGVAPEKCTAIPVGLNPPLGEPDRTEAGQRLDERYGLDANRPIVLTAGRLVRRKGVAWFVREVLPSLVDNHADLTYVVVGDGPERNAIERAAAEARMQDHVTLLGRVPDDVLADLYAVADVFVMPNVPIENDMEGFGIVAIEAASRGLPVVASRIDGIPDAIANGQNGLLLPPLEAEPWIAAVDGLLSDPASRRELGDKARTHTCAVYRWDRLAADYVRAFGAGQGAADWDRAYLHVRRSESRRLKRLRAFGIPTEARILDYGCGDGINTRLLRSLGCERVVSMDNSLRLLSAGRPPTAVAGDAHRTPFANGAFDTVLVDGVLHHLEPDRALHEIARILRPDGTLYLVEPAGSPMRTLLDRATFSPIGTLWGELRHRRVSLAEEWQTYQAWLKVEPHLPEFLANADLHIVTMVRTPLNVIATCVRGPASNRQNSERWKGRSE